MCELLGMSANVPTDIRFSFAGLARRGGGAGPHRDGWGIAFYEGRSARAFHDPEPAASSDIARFVGSHPIKSRTVIAHIRQANRGRVTLANTHPFSRELWGRVWTFAHNGQLRGVKTLRLDFYGPVGTTDSEHAFCWMLDQLRTRFESLPPPPQLDREILQLSTKLARLGVFNMLLSDSRTLYAFCGKRLACLTRRAPFGEATLIDEDRKVNFAEETGPNDCVTVVATGPLTSDESWTAIKPGTLLALREGQVAATLFIEPPGGEKPARAKRTVPC
ncbi:class II glutamine amidotransferase [Rhodoblastus sp. 17X3]|uniref:class II glutamine amidotransferase n=1 Tax=Rhodoblastus sp. 17X3 TaxID=3047026 RepID=UPI0024B74E99|nr:class II glutamine amidotransferase [Rhodoblastus sp. 17X3]MDI9848534.1 class II glutamine amidotransferase [Rhodoblastus sp. 17X3]